MGVNINVYTIYGIKTPWDDAFHEEYERIEEILVYEFGYGKPLPADRQIEVLIDGMSGEYFIFGKILYDSGDFRYCDDMNDYQELNLNEFEQIKQDYILNFNRLYPNFSHLIQDKEWKLLNLIHYH